MRPLVLALLVSLVVMACGAAVAPTRSDAPATPATAATSPVGTAATAPATAAAAKPAFLTTSLTDVRTGAPFTIGGFPGKVVLVIAMAVW